MFKPMRRLKQQISEEKCIEVLNNEPRGVLALIDAEGYPYTVPINFVYDNGSVYFHCAPVGHKIEAIKANSKASFCVMDKGYKEENDWALYINSVVAFGNIRILEDRNEIIDKIRLLGLKYYPDADEVEMEIEKYGNKVSCLELKIEHMTGKLVHEK